MLHSGYFPRNRVACGDDTSGYKASLVARIIEIGWMAHARRKLHDLHVANQSQIAEQALALIRSLYNVERDARALTPQARQLLRQQRSLPILDRLHQWLTIHRQQVPNGSATAKALCVNLSLSQPIFR